MKFYFKLAATNLKADRRLFVPFVTMTTAIISVILIIYANNFLRKQRIRQLGLYNIIGFGKRELSKMMATEKLLLLLTTLLCGGILGTVLSRLSYLTLAKMLHVNHNLDFGLSQTAFSIAGLIKTPGNGNLKPSG